ncbi:MAG: MFS transporter [Clostridia bacterium]|nr:MFS transporter [Clostridia bacterium]
MLANDKRVKYACYATNISMSVVGNLSPLLFITFRTLYHISYSLLGLLVLVNFSTQLLVDLIFSFFSHKFNIAKTVKFTPVLSVIGLVFYALMPLFFAQTAYIWLLVGTVIFSASAGLAEVLISPTIAALPAENPEREMSKLHSIYAWGVVAVILFSTLFLLIFKGESWHYLALILALVPLVAAILFSGVEMPQMQTPEKTSGALAYFKKKDLWLCVFAIFLGGASECTMAQWSSSYLEKALGIPKLLGDVFGVALFGLTLGLGRTLYAKYGKNIEKVLFLGAIGAAACYLIAALSSFPLVGLLACAATGFCTSMLWPGSLIVASDRFPTGGVFIYAMMAAGGDLGASIGPQLVGVVTDGIAANPAAIEWASALSLSPEQLGMKIGMLVGMLFPLVAIGIFHIIKKSKKDRA